MTAMTFASALKHAPRTKRPSQKTRQAFEHSLLAVLVSNGWEQSIQYGHLHLIRSTYSVKRGKHWRKEKGQGWTAQISVAAESEVLGGYNTVLFSGGDTKQLKPTFAGRLRNLCEAAWIVGIRKINVTFNHEKDGRTSHEIMELAAEAEEWNSDTWNEREHQ
jgi:hypothetical protein